MFIIYFFEFYTGQTLNEAKEAFNSGVSEIQANNYKAAIAQFNNCLEIFSELDEADAMEGEDMIIQIESKLPTLHYQVAMESVQAKEIDKAIPEFEKTVEIAKKYNDQPTAVKAEQIIHSYIIKKQGENIRARILPVL